MLSVLRRCVLAAAIAILPTVALAQAGVTRRLAPSTLPTLEQGARRTYGSPLLITGQIIGGTLAAAGAGLFAWATYDHPNAPDRRVKGDAGYTPNANTAYAVGSYAGAVASTYLLGRLDRSHGNLLGAALGAAIPTIPLLFGRDEPYLPLIGIVFGAPAQAIGGMLGDQLTRRQ